MNERILNLLSLCMQAMESGFDIKLEVQHGCRPSSILVDLWHHGEDFIIKHIGDIDEAEAYIKELITNVEPKTN